jgi:hypothetical protein
VPTCGHLSRETRRLDRCRLVPRAGLQSDSTSSTSSVAFDACDYDLSAPQPHFGTKFLQASASGSSSPGEPLEHAIREVIKALGASKDSMYTILPDEGMNGVEGSRKHLLSFMEAKQLPSLEMPSVGLPKMPRVEFSLPSALDKTRSIVDSTYGSTQNVLANRIERLGDDVANMASSMRDFTPNSVQKAATSIVGDIHGIREQLDRHELICLPTLLKHLELLGSHVEQSPHFGTDMLIDISKATAADTLVLWSELARFIGMSKVAQIVIEFFVIG